MLLNQSLSVALAAALALPLSAQQASGPTSALVGQSQGGLTLTVIEGEGAKNNIRSRTGVAPIVEVKDAAGKPVVGAEVVFQLPMVGPSAVFNGWLKTQTVRTDSEGRAAATGYAPNAEPGRFNIKVTATSGNQSGSVVVAQANVENGSGASAARRPGWWKWAAGVGGAGIVLGVVAATRNGGTTTTTTATPVPVTVSVGAVTVGVPR